MDPVDNDWGEAQQLTEVLLDGAARWDERDDAAMALGDVDDPLALEVVLRVGRDTREDETLLETIGEAIGEIIKRWPDRADDQIEHLAPIAFRAFREIASG